MFIQAKWLPKDKLALDSVVISVKHLNFTINDRALRKFEVWNNSFLIL